VTPYYEDAARGVTIYCADNRDVLPGMDDESVDFIFTDPPYGNKNLDGDLMASRKEWNGEGAQARPIANDGDEADALVAWSMGESNRLLKPGHCCAYCSGGGGPNPSFARWTLALDEAVGFKMAVVWDKVGPGIGWHYRRQYEMVLVGEKPGAPCHWFGEKNVANVVRLFHERITTSTHPTPKPVGLPARFIEWHSAPGDLVLDPFMGGGSTAEAAVRAGRRFIGIELTEQWCELTAKRLDQLPLPLAYLPQAYQQPQLFEEEEVG